MIIKEVYYDGTKLKQGLVGVPATYRADANAPLGKGNSVKAFETNELIFAEIGRWNLVADWHEKPVMHAGGIASMYIGVTAREGSSHRLTIITEESEFSFDLIYRT